MQSLPWAGLRLTRRGAPGCYLTEATGIPAPRRTDLRVEESTTGTLYADDKHSTLRRAARYPASDKRVMALARLSTPGAAPRGARHLFRAGRLLAPASHPFRPAGDPFRSAGQLLAPASRSFRSGFGRELVGGPTLETIRAPRTRCQALIPGKRSERRLQRR